jgi:hypothetical protein
MNATPWLLYRRYRKTTAAAICVGALIVWKVVPFAASSVSKVLGK